VKLHEIDTPALLLDLDVMERNLAKMARFFGVGPTRLRPHYKNHKCPVLARRQKDAGATGMTCATLAEAEVLVSNGITDILISSELAGDLKIGRFVELARQADVKAVVDNARAVAAIRSGGKGKQVSPRRPCQCQRGPKSHGRDTRRARGGTGPRGYRRRAEAPRPDGLRGPRGTSGRGFCLNHISLRMRSFRDH